MFSVSSCEVSGSGDKLYTKTGPGGTMTNTWSTHNVDIPSPNYANIYYSPPEPNVGNNLCPYQIPSSTDGYSYHNFGDNSAVTAMNTQNNTYNIDYVYPSPESNCGGYYGATSDMNNSSPENKQIMNLSPEHSNVPFNYQNCYVSSSPEVSCDGKYVPPVPTSENAYNYGQVSVNNGNYHCNAQNFVNNGHYPANFGNVGVSPNINHAPVYVSNSCQYGEGSTTYISAQDPNEYSSDLTALIAEKGRVVDEVSIDDIIKETESMNRITYNGWGTPQVNAMQMTPPLEQQYTTLDVPNSIPSTLASMNNCCPPTSEMAVPYNPMSNQQSGVGWEEPKGGASSQNRCNSTNHNGAVQKKTAKRKRTRTAFTNSQLIFLEKEYARNPYLCRPRRIQVSEALNLSERQIKIWFQNHRMKEKKMKMANSETSAKTVSRGPGRPRSQKKSCDSEQTIVDRLLSFSPSVGGSMTSVPGAKFNNGNVHDTPVSEFSL